MCITSTRRALFNCKRDPFVSLPGRRQFIDSLKPRLPSKRSNIRRRRWTLKNGPFNRFWTIELIYGAIECWKLWWWLLVLDLIYGASRKLAPNRGRLLMEFLSPIGTRSSTALGMNHYASGEGAIIVNWFIIYIRAAYFLHRKLSTNFDGESSHSKLFETFKCYNFSSTADRSDCKVSSTHHSNK